MAGFKKGFLLGKKTKKPPPPVTKSLLEWEKGSLASLRVETVDVKPSFSLIEEVETETSLEVTTVVETANDKHAVASINVLPTPRAATNSPPLVSIQEDSTSHGDESFALLSRSLADLLWKLRHSKTVDASELLDHPDLDGLWLWNAILPTASKAHRRLGLQAWSRRNLRKSLASVLAASKSSDVLLDGIRLIREGLGSDASDFWELFLPILASIVTASTSRTMLCQKALQTAYFGIVEASRQGVPTVSDPSWICSVRDLLDKHKEWLTEQSSFRNTCRVAIVRDWRRVVDEIEDGGLDTHAFLGGGFPRADLYATLTPDDKDGSEPLAVIESWKNDHIPPKLDTRSTARALVGWVGLRRHNVEMITRDLLPILSSVAVQCFESNHVEVGVYLLRTTWERSRALSAPDEEFHSSLHSLMEILSKANWARFAELGLVDEVASVVALGFQAIGFKGYEEALVTYTGADFLRPLTARLLDSFQSENDREDFLLSAFCFLLRSSQQDCAAVDLLVLHRDAFRDIPFQTTMRHLLLTLSEIDSDQHITFESMCQVLIVVVKDKFAAFLEYLIALESDTEPKHASKAIDVPQLCARFGTFIANYSVAPDELQSMIMDIVSAYFTHSSALCPLTLFGSLSEGLQSHRETDIIWLSTIDHILAVSVDYLQRIDEADHAAGDSDVCERLAPLLLLRRCPSAYFRLFRKNLSIDGDTPNPAIDVLRRVGKCLRSRILRRRLASPVEMQEVRLAAEVAGKLLPWDSNDSLVSVSCYRVLCEPAFRSFLLPVRGTITHSAASPREDDVARSTRAALSGLHAAAQAILSSGSDEPCEDLLYVAQFAFSMILVEEDAVSSQNEADHIARIQPACIDFMTSLAHRALSSEQQDRGTVSISSTRSLENILVTTNNDLLNVLLRSNSSGGRLTTEPDAAIPRISPSASERLWLIYTRLAHGRLDKDMALRCSQAIVPLSCRRGQERAWLDDPRLSRVVMMVAFGFLTQVRSIAALGSNREEQIQTIANLRLWTRHEFQRQRERSHSRDSLMSSLAALKLLHLFHKLVSESDDRRIPLCSNVIEDTVQADNMFALEMIPTETVDELRTELLSIASITSPA